MLSHLQLYIERISILIVSLIVGLSIVTSAQDSLIITPFSYPGEEFTHHNLAEHIILYPLDSPDLRNLDSISINSLPVLSTEEIDTMRGKDTIWVWGHFTIVNKHKNLQQDYLYFTNRVDSLELFIWNKNKLELVGTTGDNLIINKNNYILTNDRIIPIPIGTYSTQHYYFRARIIKYKIDWLKEDISIFNGRSYLAGKMRMIGQQYLFEGTMLICIFLCIIMFFVFKENIFIHYGLLILIMVYFTGNDEIGILPGKYLFKSEIINNINIIGLLLSGLAAVGFYFISAELELKKHWKSVYKIFAGITKAIVIFGILGAILHHLGEIFGVFILMGTILFVLWNIVSIIAIVQGVINKRLEAIVLFIGYFFLLFGPVLFDYLIPGVFERRNNNVLANSVFSFFGVLLFSLIHRIHKIQKDRITFQVGKEKSDELLFNILPVEVATELIEKGESQARLIDQVSVLFTDFKEFTQTASNLSPEALVNEINECFKAFDEITQVYKIEKIKTIGDAYMAAAGLNSDTDDVVLNIIKAALDMQAFILKRKETCISEGKPYFEMRLGIHTGNVVAGIVGVKKFQYDIWGDTVNIASRMESYGEVGQVNISQTTYELLKNHKEFHFESRGKISVKGKGEMDMWFVKHSSVM